MKHYQMQLRSLLTGALISSSGGVAYVTAAGGTAKLALTDKNGAALANPVAMTNGKIDFYVADTVASVDIYVQSGKGHFVSAKGMAPSGDSSLNIDTSRLDVVYVIPFNIADTTANVETDTGFKLFGETLATPAVDVVTTDAAKTIAVGSLATAATGFITGLLLTTAGMIKASLLNGSVTLGADLKVQDSANAGDAVPEPNTSRSGINISYTLAAATTTGAGFIVLPVRLRPSN